MTIEAWLLYVATVFLVSATPGPNMLLALTHGLRYGLRRTLVTCLGLMSGLGIIMAASAAGLGALLAASEEAFLVLKYLGAAYLIYLGLRVCCSDSSALAGPNDPGAGEGAWQRFRVGLWVSLSNPKAFVFFAALFPQFIDATKPQGAQFVLLVATFVVIESAWQLAYAVGGARLARWLGTGRRLCWVNRLSGGAFVSAGLLLGAMSRR